MQTSDQSWGEAKRTLVIGDIHGNYRIVTMFRKMSI
jgi:hypothetical protein